MILILNWFLKISMNLTEKYGLECQNQGIAVSNLQMALPRR